MKLAPAKLKYKKVQKGRIYGNAKRGNKISFGDFGIQALERGLLTASMLESVRVAISRSIKRKGKIWCRVFPHKPITKKPAETRMGKGKGSVEYYVAVIKPGMVLFEITGVNALLAREAFSIADRKLPIKCRFIEKILDY